MHTNVTTRNVEVVIIDSVKRLDIRVTDEDGELLAADEVSLKLTDLSGNVIYEDDMNDPPTPPGTTRIITPSMGIYYFALGDQTLFPLTVGGDANEETAFSQDLLAQWHVEVDTDEHIDFVQLVKVISPRVASMMTIFQKLIDKSAKLISEDPDDPCFLGYTPADLLTYMENGLTLINAFQPYPVWNRLDDFPIIHRQLLFDAALIVGLTSQELFAIDTDINYSDQGNVFVIQHHPMLQATSNVIWARLEKMVPAMKKQYVQSGSIHVETGPNFRLAQLLAAAPPGATFRNTWTS